MTIDNFHSSREERLAASSAATRLAYENRKHKSFFKRNPQIKILMFDLFIVFLFAAIIVPFFLKLTKDVRMDDFRVESKSIVFENKILVTVKIIKLNKKIKKRVTTDSIKVAIISEDGSILKEITDLLPDKSEKFKYFSFKLDDNEKTEIINIELQSGSYEKKYKVHVER